jgi:capsular exopolysaccharide synthesis family protein
VSPQALREKRIVATNDLSIPANAYRILRTQVLQRMQANGWNTLAITSPGENEGKTLTAINLAISLAKEVTFTVLLVDANLRQPTVHEYFGLDLQPGLSDYLVHDRPLSELLINPAGLDRFVLLPGGQPLANSSEMLNSPKMARLVEDLKTRYPKRIVLFDLPPLLSSSDALAFSPYVDAALLVLEDSKTQVEDAQHASNMLEKTPIVGTVLNKSRRAAPLASESSGRKPGLPRGLSERWARLIDRIRLRMRRSRSSRA